MSEIFENNFIAQFKKKAEILQRTFFWNLVLIDFYSVSLQSAPPSYFPFKPLTVSFPSSFISTFSPSLYRAQS